MVTMMTGAAMAGRKDQFNARLSETGFNILYALQDYHGLSQAGVLELLLRKEARELGWDPKHPPRSLGGGRGK